MEIKREPLTGAPTDFRSRQLLARDMLAAISRARRSSATSSRR